MAQANQGRATQAGTNAPSAAKDNQNQTGTVRPGERGAASLDLLTLGISNFVRDDVLPAAKRIKEAADSIRNLLAPSTRGKYAGDTALIVRANAAQRARSADIADKALEGARKFYEGQKPADNLDSLDRIQRNQKQKDPKAQSLADTLFNLLDGHEKAINGLGQGKLYQFYRTYFPQLFTNPARASVEVEKILGRTKLPLFDCKSRTLPTFQDIANAGVDPISHNPVELSTALIAQATKFVEMHREIGEMYSQGMIRFFKDPKRVPTGYTAIDERISNATLPRTSKGTKGQAVIGGRYYAPDVAARVINNHYSPGLEETMFAAPFRAWRTIGNSMNQAQLGLSFFHGGFVTVNAMVSRFALGLEDVFKYGRPVRGVKTMASTVVSPITDLVQGNRMLREWFRPGSQGQEVQDLVEMMMQGGGRARMDSFYKTNITNRMMEAFRAGNVIGGAARLPFAGFEKVAKPVLEYLVPRMKAGAFAEMARRELEALGPNATLMERRAAMAKAWDSVDNRLGEMVYDNLFWNKYFKDVSLASIRAVGWTLGTFRELGGGAIDAAKYPAPVGMYLGAKLGGNKAPAPEFTHRMAYSIALPVVVGAMGALAQYLLTGKGPQELKDYYFPQTGNLDEYGRPERISFPSYMKDVFSFAEHPGRTVTSKLHPMIGTIAEMLENRDFYGTEIRSADDSPLQQALDLAKYAGRSFEPFFLRNLTQERERGASLKQQAAAFVGVTPAPADINRTPAEKLLSQYLNQDFGERTRTKAEAARSDALNKLVRAKRMGKDVDAETEAAIKAGTIKRSDAELINRRSEGSTLTTGYQHLTADQAARVFAVASDKERDSLRPLLFGKVTHIPPGELTPEMEKRLRSLHVDEIDRLVSDRKPVESELQRLGIKSPSATGRLTVEEEKLKLNPDQLEEYQGRVTERVYHSLPLMLTDKRYHSLDDEGQKRAIARYEKELRSVEAAQERARLKPSNHDLKVEAKDKAADWRVDERSTIIDILEDERDRMLERAGKKHRSSPAPSDNKPTSENKPQSSVTPGTFPAPYARRIFRPMVAAEPRRGSPGWSEVTRLGLPIGYPQQNAGEANDSYQARLLKDGRQVKAMLDELASDSEYRKMSDREKRAAIKDRLRSIRVPEVV